MRQIHWAKTALYDKLVSYDQEGQAITDAIVRLDTHPTLHNGLGHDSSLEWIIRIAASICDTLLSQGIRITAVTEGGEFRAWSKGSIRTSLLDWFAELDTSHDCEERSSDQFRPNHQASVLTFRITTDLSTNLASNSIVVKTESGEHTETTTARLAKGWMTVGRSADIPSQIRAGWRNGPRRIRHAV